MHGKNEMPHGLSADDLDCLRRVDTPTICNAIEIVAPERRGFGYTTETLICARPELPPILGFARTATIRARQPGGRTPEEARALRFDYLKYVAESGPTPSIIVIQDLDGASAGFGCFWGEVHSNMHRALGAVGAITDGAMRDLDVLADGFQLLARKVVPSHAYDHLVDFGGEVNVCGMVVQDGDLIHADRHGAVVVPAALVSAIPAAAELLQRREALLLETFREPGFDYDRLIAAIAEAEQIH